MANRVALDQELPDISASQALWARAARVIPCGTQTLAKGPTQYVDGVAPKYLARGKGCRVWDVDGNEFIDLTMAVGPVVLGYGHPAVDRAIAEQLESGITFSLMHPLEVEVAELKCCAAATTAGTTGISARPRAELACRWPAAA